MNVTCTLGMPCSPSGPRSIRTSGSSPSLVRWYPVLASRVVVPDRSQRPSRARTPLHSVQGSVPRGTGTGDETPPPAAVIPGGVEQPGRDQAASQVLHVVHVDDVVDDTRDALGQLGRGAHPGDPVVAGHDGGVTEALRASPQATDVGQQPNSHRRSPPGLVIPCAMSVHLS